MLSPDLWSLIQQWREAGATAPGLAAAFERCAADLEHVMHAGAGQPPGLATVGVLDGLADRVFLVMNSAGLYGVQSYPLIPGQARTATFPDGHRELAPNRVYAPSMRWRRALQLATQLTDDRGDDGPLATDDSR